MPTKNCGASEGTDIKCLVGAQLLFVFSLLQLKCDISVKIFRKRPNTIFRFWPLVCPTPEPCPSTGGNCAGQPFSLRDAHPCSDAAEGGGKCCPCHQCPSLAW